MSEEAAAAPAPEAGGEETPQEPTNTVKVGIRRHLPSPPFHSAAWAVRLPSPASLRENQPGSTTKCTQFCVSPSPLIASHLMPPPCHSVTKSIHGPIDPPPLSTPPSLGSSRYISDRLHATLSPQQRPTDDQAARWDGDACPRRRRVRLHRPRHGPQGVHHQRHHVCRRQKGRKYSLHVTPTSAPPHISPLHTHRAERIRQNLPLAKMEKTNPCPHATR